MLSFRMHPIACANGPAGVALRSRMPRRVQPVRARVRGSVAKTSYGPVTSDRDAYLFEAFEDETAPDLLADNEDEEDMEDECSAFEASMRVLLAPSKKFTPPPAKQKSASMGPAVEPAAAIEVADVSSAHPEAAFEEDEDETVSYEEEYEEVIPHEQADDSPQIPAVELTLELGIAAEEDGWAGRESGYEAYWEEPILPPLLSEQTQRIEQLLRGADIDAERKELALTPARRASVIAKRALEATVLANEWAESEAMAAAAEALRSTQERLDWADAADSVAGEGGGESGRDDDEEEAAAMAPEMAAARARAAAAMEDLVAASRLEVRRSAARAERMLAGLDSAAAEGRGDAVAAAQAAVERAERARAAAAAAEAEAEALMSHATRVMGRTSFAGKVRYMGTDDNNDEE